MAHALLSPSSASRWLACTPSARLESKFENKTSSFAEEGTLAHSINEVNLSWELGWPIDSKSYKAMLTDPLHKEEMDDYCNGFTEFVMEEWNTVKTKDPGAQIFLERKLDMTEWVEDGFGTGDVVILSQGELHIIDFKYGKGVPVYAPENKQMMLYALGALHSFDFIYDVERVKMTIYQPRIDNVSSWSMNALELVDWAETVLRPRAALAYEGKGEFIPGDHCYFCRAKANCRAFAEEQLKIAKEDLMGDLARPELLTDDEVADVMKRASMFEKWISAVWEYALDQALTHGKHWPGYKVVESKKNRVYADEVQVADKLIGLGYKSGDIYKEPELKGIGAIEKLLKKKVFEAELGSLVIKPKGVPTLAQADDKRPEYDRIAEAKKDFEINN